MAFFSFRDCNIRINEQDVYISHADLTLDASINGLLLVGQASPNEYAPLQAVNNSLKITYYLTGRDSLKDFIIDNTHFISGSIAGLSFQTGTLRSYTFNALPFAPAEIQAEIAFWGPLVGTFNPISQPSVDFTPLHINNAILLGNRTLGIFEHSISFNYQATIDVFPTFKLGSIYPDSIIFGQRSAVGTFVYDGFSGEMPANGAARGGLPASLLISLGDASGIIQESFSITGPIFRKELSTQVREPLVSTITMRQDALFPTPTVTAVYPNPASIFDTIVVSGTNLDNILQVYFGPTRAAWGTYVKGLSLNVEVPENVMNSFVYVTTKGGTARSIFPFMLTGNFPEF